MCACVKLILHKIPIEKVRVQERVNNVNHPVDALYVALYHISLVELECDPGRPWLRLPPPEQPPLPGLHVQRYQTQSFDFHHVVDLLERHHVLHKVVPDHLSQNRQVVLLSNLQQDISL